MAWSLFNRTYRPANPDDAPRSAGSRTRPPDAPIIGTAISRPKDTVLPAPTAPPAFDPNALDAAGLSAGQRQRKRIADAVNGLPGQPNGQGINPNAVLKRQTLVPYV